MGAIGLAPGETPIMDYTAPLSTMTYPLLELVATTGLGWMAAGFVDRQGDAGPLAPLRGAILLLWFLVVVWRFVLPLVAQRRRRFIVTSDRVIVRAAGLRTKAHSFSHRQVLAAERRRGTIWLTVYGLPTPLRCDGIPHSKKVATLVNHLAAQRPIGV